MVCWSLNLATRCKNQCIITCVDHVWNSKHPYFLSQISTSLHTTPRFMCLQLRKHEPAKSLKSPYCKPPPFGNQHHQAFQRSDSQWKTTSQSSVELPNALMPRLVWLIKRTFPTKHAIKKRGMMEPLKWWTLQAAPLLHTADMSGCHLKTEQVESSWYNSHVLLTCYCVPWRYFSFFTFCNFGCCTLSLLANMLLGAAMSVGKSSCNCCAPHHSWSLAELLNCRCCQMWNLHLWVKLM